MIIFPNCKINLGLTVLRKREDGYHDLETIFYPVPAKDVLEVVTSSQSLVSDNVTFTSSGLPVDGPVTDNLCIKAYHLLKKDFPQLPPVHMHLHKTIPIGAGLGGGSSNGAFTLKLLNDKFNLNIPRQQLISYALELGSDCPFFVVNKPCFARGRGELLEEIAIDLSLYSFILVNPGIHINTGWAFSNIIPAELRKESGKISLKDAIQEPINAWKDHLINDFEKPVFDLYPEIKEIRDTLYKEGALYASMSGTGSTVFGIFDKNKQIRPTFPDSYFVFEW